MSKQLLQWCASFTYSWLTITPTQEGVWASLGFCIHAHTHVTHYTAASLRQCSLTQTHELKCCSLEKRLNLEANLAACHGVAQLSLIVNEGHYA